MSSIFRAKLEDELERRHISIREAAKQMGISHTTLIAARNGRRSMDLDTALAIAKWVGVPLSTLVPEANPEEAEKNKVTQAIEIVIRAAPDLEQMFKEAADEFAAGRLTLSDFTDILEYATYKIRVRREKAQANEQGKVSQTDR